MRHEFFLTDPAFEAEFVPSIGLKGNEHGFKGALILSKNHHSRFIVHINVAYELETEREIDVSPPSDEVVNHATWFYNVAPMFRVFPDRLMVLAELNGQTKASDNTELTLGSEVIGVIQTETSFALQNLTFKTCCPLRA